jgi:L-ribulose-5-phosphate 4-epimerase
MTEESNYKAKLKVCRYSHLSYRRSLVSAAGGNVSCREKGRIFITAGGRSLRDIGIKDIIEVDLEGRPVLKDNTCKPSKELWLHLNIYRAREDVNAVIHVHPVYATALTLSGDTIPMATVSSRLKLGKVPLIGCADPGSRELADMIYEAAAESDESIKAIMLMEHGLIAFSGDLEDCFNTAELVEETAKIAYIAESMNNIIGKVT